MDLTIDEPTPQIATGTRALRRPDVTGRGGPSDPPPLLWARGLHRRWGSGEGSTVALDGVDLTVGRGELLAVVSYLRSFT